MDLLALASLMFAIPPVPVTRGAAVNVTPFGQSEQWDADGKDFGIFWEDAREIFRVEVVFDGAVAIEKLPGLRIEYWQSCWPERRIPRDEPSGAGSAGWIEVGDWYQGRWIAADTKLETDGARYAFTFNPVNAKEFPALADFSAEYRSTLKLRVVADVPLPKVAAFDAYTDSVWDTQDFDVVWSAKKPAWEGRIEVFNGTVSAVKSDDNGVHASILYAKTNSYHSFDETVVTVRDGDNTFSFAPKDLAKHGHMFLRGFGAVVRLQGDETTYAAADRKWQEDRDKTIYQRVFQEPEQTFARAWGDMPTKGRFYIPISFEGGRQHFGVNPDGSVFTRYNWLTRCPGKDTLRVLYDGDEIRYRFGFTDAELTGRHRIDGCLPMIVAQWERGGVRYKQTAFAVPLDGVPAPGEWILADDTLVLMLRFEIERIGDGTPEAAMDLACEANAVETLELEDGFIFAPGGDDMRRLRMVASSPDAADSYTIEGKGASVAYRAALTGAAPKRTLDVAIPYITLTEPEEWARVKTIAFASAFEAVSEYWRGRIAESAQITTPEPAISDFYNAHASHLLINTEREVDGSDRYVSKVGTFGYGAFSNESCMMISDLDRRGYHERAAQALEIWLHYQGSVPLPGDYSSGEGVFYGAGKYEDGAYNQHHGFVLWCLGEHYWYTRDAEWLAHAAPYIVKGCEWVIRERQRTVEAAERWPIRVIERGLLPPGSLEDIRDWRCWLSNNNYSWWGMDNAARAMAAAGLPEGERLVAEAAAYREDILAAFTEAMRRSPVVPLRDGRWIAHIPPEVHRRGRTFGWITETLEGAMQLIRTDTIDPESRLATWIIEDYEDNLYISEQFGYNITGDEFDRYWFSRGGISMQANLLINPIPYLQRDEPEHFLRAYFNAFAVSFFDDTRMMCEHALPNIGDWRGDHYKSSDEANSTYWLRLMFVEERGGELWLGAAIPRSWLTEGRRVGIEDARTYYGPCSATWQSRVDEGRIAMTLEPPVRNAPERIRVRFRHPGSRRMTRCEVNGAAYPNFDADKEWVTLTNCQAITEVVAYYD